MQKKCSCCGLPYQDCVWKIAGLNDKQAAQAEEWLRQAMEGIINELAPNYLLPPHAEWDLSPQMALLECQDLERMWKLPAKGYEGHR